MQQIFEIMRRETMRFTIILLTLLLASCGSYSLPSSLTSDSAYKMDIRQGNFFDFAALNRQQFLGPGPEVASQVIKR